MNSDPPLLSGTVPGLLDSSQPSRLLRSSSSSLFFAPFDPHTARATGFPNLSSLHIDPTKVPKRVNPETVTGSNGKRIVVEIDSENGTCSWRFVPRAKTESGLSGDEGSFPRLVELCGQLVRMTQDQWDLHKLDPFYDCVVRAHPNITKITKVTSRKPPLNLDDAATSDSMPTPKQDSSKATSSGPYSWRDKRFKPSTGFKRTVSTQTDSMSVDEDSSFIPNQATPVTDQDVINDKKKQRDRDPSRKWTPEAENLGTAQEHALDPDDVVASDSMPTPKQDSSKASSSSYSSLYNKFIPSTGLKRTVSTQTDSMSVDGDSFYIPRQATPVTDQDINNMKRKWDPDPSRRWTTEAENSRRTAPEYRAFRDEDPFHSRSESSGVNDSSNSDIPAKKVRTRSPGAVRRELEKKRTKREMKRRAHMEARLKFRKDVLHQAFWDNIGIPSGWQNPGLYEVPTGMSSESDSSTDESNGRSSSHSSSTTGGEDEAQRLARIEESRRKLAELEKDRPLWEESAKRRQAREKEEEEMRQRAKKAKEEEERRQQQAQAARRQRHEKREKERQELQREKRIKEKKCRMFVLSRPNGFWSFRLALNRYLQTAATFDATKFSAGGTSLTFAAIPWPMLDSSFSVQDIDWDAVEKFFGNVKMLLNAAEYKDLIEKSHKRFHPDRWRSRGLLLSVEDELEKDLLEVAGSTVAQAITPLWKNVTGR